MSEREHTDNGRDGPAIYETSVAMGSAPTPVVTGVTPNIDVDTTSTMLDFTLGHARGVGPSADSVWTGSDQPDV